MNEADLKERIGQQERVGNARRRLVGEARGCLQFLDALREPQGEPTRLILFRGHLTASCGPKSFGVPASEAPQFQALLKWMQARAEGRAAELAAVLDRNDEAELLTLAPPMEVL